jgi:hypothetical protein
MVRSVVSKVMWVGRATVFLVGLAVILALIFGVLSRATAHTGSAGLFHLNHNNPVKALSTLTGTLAGSVLKVDNNGAGPALSLEVSGAKAPPLTVNSTAGTATNLSADKLDGKDSTDFLAQQDASQLWDGRNYLLESSFIQGKANSSETAQITCDAGDTALSGGYFFEGTASGYEIRIDKVSANTETFTFGWEDTNGTPDSLFNISVSCADFPPFHL